MWVCGVGRGEGSDGGKKGSKDRPLEATDERGRMDAVRYTKRMGGKGVGRGHGGSEERMHGDGVQDETEDRGSGHGMEMG